MIVKFANDKARRAWLDAYHAWGLWFAVPQTGATWYRCFLPDGAMFAVEEYPEIHHTHPVSYTTQTRNFYHLPEGHSFGGERSSETELVGVIHNLRGDVEIQYPDNPLDRIPCLSQWTEGRQQDDQIRND